MKDLLLDEKHIEFWRASLLAVSPHYPGFLPAEMKKGINAICDMALESIKLREDEHNRSVDSVSFGPKT
jgi:hypothetical protein